MHKIIDSAVAATEAMLHDVSEDAVDGVASMALKQLQRVKTKGWLSVSVLLL